MSAREGPLHDDDMIDLLDQARLTAERQARHLQKRLQTATRVQALRLARLGHPPLDEFVRECIDGNGAGAAQDAVLAFSIDMRSKLDESQERAKQLEDLAFEETASLEEAANIALHNRAGGGIPIAGAESGAQAGIELTVPSSSYTVPGLNESDALQGSALLWEIAEAALLRAKGLAAPRVIRALQERLCPSTDSVTVVQLHEALTIPALQGALDADVGQGSRVRLVDAVVGTSARCLMSGDVGYALAMLLAVKESGEGCQGVEAAFKAAEALDEAFGGSRLGRVMLRGQAGLLEDDDMDDDEREGTQVGLRRGDVLDGSPGAAEAVRARQRVRSKHREWQEGVRRECQRLGVEVEGVQSVRMAASGAGTGDAGAADVSLAAAGMLRLLCGDVDGGLRTLEGLPVLTAGSAAHLSALAEGLQREGGMATAAQVVEAVEAGGGVEELAPAWTHRFMCSLVLRGGAFAEASGDGLAAAFREAMRFMGDSGVPQGLPEACASVCEGVASPALEWMTSAGAVVPAAQLAVLLQGAGHLPPSGLELAEGGEVVVGRYGVGLRDTLVLDAAHEVLRLAGAAGRAPASDRLGGTARGLDFGGASDGAEKGEEEDTPGPWSLGFQFALLCTDHAEAVALSMAGAMLERQALATDREVQQAVGLAADAGMEELAGRIAARRGQAWLDRGRLDCALRWFALAEDSDGLWRVGGRLLALLVGPNEQPTLPPAVARQVLRVDSGERASLSRDLSTERQKIDALALSYACLVLRPLLPGGLGGREEGGAESWDLDPRLDGPGDRGRSGSGAAQAAIGSDPPSMSAERCVSTLVLCPLLLTCVQIACCRLAVVDAAACLRSAQRLPDASTGFGKAAHRRWFSGTAAVLGLGPIGARKESAAAEARTGAEGGAIAVDLHRTAAGSCPLACSGFQRQGAAAQVAPERGSGGAEWVRGGCLRRAAVALHGLVAGSELERCPRVLVAPLLLRAHRGGLLGAGPCPFSAAEATGLLAALELQRQHAERETSNRRGAAAGSGPAASVPAIGSLLGALEAERAVGEAYGEATADTGPQLIPTESPQPKLDATALAGLGGLSVVQLDSVHESLLDCMSMAVLQEADGAGPVEAGDGGLAIAGIDTRDGLPAVVSRLWEVCRGAASGPRVFSSGGREQAVFEGELPPVGALACGSASIISERKAAEAVAAAGVAATTSNGRGTTGGDSDPMAASVLLNRGRDAAQSPRRAGKSNGNEATAVTSPRLGFPALAGESWLQSPSKAQADIFALGAGGAADSVSTAGAPTERARGASPPPFADTSRIGRSTQGFSAAKGDKGGANGSGLGRGTRMGLDGLGSPGLPSAGMDIFGLG